MALKKSELYSALWSSCDALRGGMDASQYKDYVLVLLFLRYVSDKYAGIPYAPITIPEGSSFRDMVNLKGASDIGDQINRIIGRRHTGHLEHPERDDLTSNCWTEQLPRARVGKPIVCIQKRAKPASSSALYTYPLQIRATFNGSISA